jgi:hypothetical protein
VKAISPITLEEFGTLLKKKGNAVPWYPPEIAQPVSGFLCYLASLEASDEDRVFFWWQHQVHTVGQTGKWTDVLPNAAENSDRIRDFLEGNLAKGYVPVDLRTADGFEPMFITHDFDLGPLLAIDGNHRLEAQRISGEGLAGAMCYVCCHPAILGHRYMTGSARAWFRNKGASNA